MSAPEQLGRCPDCGKWRYATRRDARRAARRLPQLGRMNAYECGQFWHLGHLPTVIRQGKAGRDIYAPTTVSEVPTP